MCLYYCYFRKSPDSTVSTAKLENKHSKEGNKKTREESVPCTSSSASNSSITKSDDRHIRYASSSPEITKRIPFTVRESASTTITSTSSISVNTSIKKPISTKRDLSKEPSQNKKRQSSGSQPVSPKQLNSDKSNNIRNVNGKRKNTSKKS